MTSLQFTQHQLCTDWFVRIMPYSIPCVLQYTILSISIHYSGLRQIELRNVNIERPVHPKSPSAKRSK